MFRRVGPRWSLALCAVVAACLVAGAGEAVATGTPGVDASYGESGVAHVEAQMPAGYSAIPNSYGTALAAPGGAVLYVTQLSTCESVRCSTPTVRRFGRNGWLDGSYGEGGVLDLSGEGVDTERPAMEVDPQGRLLTAASQDDSLLVRRFTPTGKVDGSFGNSGQATVTGIAGASRAQAVLTAPHGRTIVAAVESTPGEAGPSGASVTLVRLLPDGRLDRGYGKKGKVVAGISPAIGVDFSVTSKGAVLMLGGGCCSGSSTSFTPVERVSPAGKVDVRFNREERKAQVKALAGFPETSVTSVVPGADGTVELLGESRGFAPGPGFALRLTAKGHLDTGFGEGGLVKLATWPVSAGVGSNGSTLLIFETFPNNSRPAAIQVERLLADGRPDPRFGGEAGIQLPEPEGGRFVSSVGGRALIEGSGAKECSLSCVSSPFLTRLIEPTGSARSGKGGKH
jgi:uncharacterized delta-60 repeat protein